jgi:hypothetical protein
MPTHVQNAAWNVESVPEPTIGPAQANPSEKPIP